MLWQKSYLASRVAYALEHHFDPGNWDVLHRCDNPSCVRPDHLWLGSHDDNMADMIAKGRFVASRGHTKIRRGSREEAIALDPSVPIATAAKMLGVTYQCVWLRRKQQLTA